LEEALDLSVYISATLVEIQQQNKGVKTMGRAIDMENSLHELETRLKLVEDALEEMIQTRVHHVDLTETNGTEIEGLKIEPDEEFTPPVGKRKKTTRKKAEATT
jgi:hypothetical protein